MEYQSTIEKASEAMPGVTYRVRRISFGRRLEITRILRDRVDRLRFLSSAQDDGDAGAEAAIVGAEIDSEYLLWGLAGITGLDIDGVAATPEALVEAGPEELVREALAHVRAVSALSEKEAKNSASHSISPSDAKPGGCAGNAAG